MAALYAVAFLSSLGFSIVLPFMVLLVLRFGGNGFALGALGALFWSVQLVGSTWLGTLSDRIGRKEVLFRSQLGAMAAWAIFLCALNVPRVPLAHASASVTGSFLLTLPLMLLGLARITDGLFDGSISVANAYMADVAEGTAREVGYARLGAATSLGFVVGPVISGLIARTDAGVSLVVILAFLLSGAAALLVRFRLAPVAPRPATATEVVCAGGVRALGGDNLNHANCAKTAADLIDQVLLGNVSDMQRLLARRGREELYTRLHEIHDDDPQRESRRARELHFNDRQFGPPFEDWPAR